MTDLTFSRSTSLDVTQVESDTEQGMEFLDAVLLPDLQVVDSGRIIIPTKNVPELQARAREAGLTLSLEVAR